MERGNYLYSKKQFFISCLFLVVFTGIGHSQKRNTDVYKFPEMQLTNSREIIRIPDIDGFFTLKCDFHSHTVFSDGQVTPIMRVNEAWNDGLDAIAISDHIEYKPFKDITNPDFNKSNEMAASYGEKIGFIVIKGAEITRKKPFGHLNALFIQDVNKLKSDDPLNSVKEAVKQGAFIMWNHPGWPNDTCTMYDIQKKMIKEKLIHGVEVFNNKEWYPKVMTWIKETGLTVMGNSDIHQTIRNTYGEQKMARPMTLVFAKEKSEVGIKEALFQGRTLAVFFNNIAGEEEFLKKLVTKCLQIKVIDLKNDLVEITNDSDLTFRIKTKDTTVEISPEKVIRCNLIKNDDVIITNCYTGENENLKIKLWQFNKPFKLLRLILS